MHGTSLADEEAVNKVAEKIDTLRMGPRQVRLDFDFIYLRSFHLFRVILIILLTFCLYQPSTNRIIVQQEHELDESTSSPSTVMLAEDLPEPVADIVPGKIVNIQPTAPLQSGITEEQKS